MSCFAVPGGPSAGLTLTSLSPARTSVPLPSAPLLATCVSFTLVRTSSRRLLPLVKKGASLQVAAGLYPAAHFCPTRLNTSDAPTRHRELPAPCPASLLSGLPAESLYRLSCLGGLSRASSGWLRLVLLYAELRGASPRVSLIKALTLKSRDCLPLSPALEFDQTLGYPGEGPLLAPRNKWDLARAAARGGSLLERAGPSLTAPRKTGRNCFRLLASGSAVLAHRFRTSSTPGPLMLRPLLAS